jgi:hypothetical protein
MGLAATGSKNTVVSDAFVPVHRTVSIVDLLVGVAPGAMLHEIHFIASHFCQFYRFALLCLFWVLQMGH